MGSVGAKRIKSIFVRSSKLIKSSSRGAPVGAPRGTHPGRRLSPPSSAHLPRRRPVAPPGEARPAGAAAGPSFPLRPWSWPARDDFPSGGASLWRGLAARRRSVGVACLGGDLVGGRGTAAAAGQIGRWRAGTPPARSARIWSLAVAGVAGWRRRSSWALHRGGLQRRGCNHVVGRSARSGGGTAPASARRRLSRTATRVREMEVFDQIWVKTCYWLLPRPAMAMLSASFPS